MRPNEPSPGAEVESLNMRIHDASIFAESPRIFRLRTASGPGMLARAEIERRRARGIGMRGSRTIGLAVVVALIGAVASAQAPKSDAKAAAEARRGLDATWKSLADRRVADRLESLFEAHEAASTAARAFLLDDEKYPVPEKAIRGWDPTVDAQPGQEEMDKLVGASLEASSALVLAVASALGSKPDRLTPPSLGPLAKIAATPVRVATLASAEGAFGRLFVRLRLASPGDRPIEAASRDLAEGRYGEAVEKGDKLTGLDARFFRMAADCEVLAWNRKNPCGHSKPEQDAGRALNLYRMALGIRPMAHNALLHEMARDFAREQSRLKFLAHDHPKDESRRTLRDRANRVGYSRDLGENCAGSGDAVSSFWMYRSDAGHHRNLVDPSKTEFGQGCAANRSVLNTGGGTDGAVMALIKREINRR